MAIDPSISLGVRPPVIAPLQIQNPLEQYGKVLTLRNLMQEQQSGQLGLQAQQLKLQQEQKGIQEDANIRQLYATNPNPSHAEIISTVGPVRGAALIKAQAEQYEQQLKTNAAKAARIGQLAGSAVDAPTYKNAIMTAVTENLIPADHGRELAALDWNDPATQAQVKQFQTQALSAEQQHTALLADLEEKRKAALAPGELAKSQAELATKQAESEQKQRQIEASTLAPALARGAVAYQQALATMKPERAALYSGFQTPRDLLMFASTPTEQITAQQAAATAAATEKQRGVQNEIDRARLGISRQEQALRQRQFDATYGALVDPTTGRAMDPETAKAVAMQDPEAVAIAGYQLGPKVSRSGAPSPIMRKVMAINPDYDAKNWQIQGSQLKNFTSGKVADQLRATNTALSHVGLLNDAIDALNNGDLRVLNALGNRLGLETGATPAAVFQTIVGKVGPELAQAYGEATGGERKVEKGNFDSSLPPQTLRANVAVTAQLLKGKIDSTKFQWQSTPGFEKKPLPMISPEAQGVLDRLGGGGQAPAAGAGFTVTDPRGVVHTFKTKKQADDFKTAAGIR
jgi:hypothetical protein